MDFLLIELSIIDHKSRKSYSNERINNWKSLFGASHFCNFRQFVVTLQIASHCHYLDKPWVSFLGDAPNPNFCVPSQFVSWSAQPLELPSETYVSALHDMWSTKARKLPMALSVN